LSPWKLLHILVTCPLITFISAPTIARLNFTLVSFRLLKNSKDMAGENVVARMWDPVYCTDVSV
jgi:hypothetical protein